MSVSPAQFTVFSQELYYDESIRAIESYADAPRRRELHARIAEQLPYPSATMRDRVASKIIQRFFVNPPTGTPHPNPPRNGEGVAPSPLRGGLGWGKRSGSYPATAFLRLVAGIKRDDLRRDLLYWRAARTDAIIEALAGELFYPHFVLGQIPMGYSEAEFHATNTATLFSIDGVITRDFAIEYARKVWEFDSPRTIALALRIMRQAEVVDATSVVLGRRRVHGYYPLSHTPRVEAFAYCIYEEFLAEGPVVAIDQLRNSAFAKVFLLGGLQVDSLVKSAERQKLLTADGRHMRLAYGSLGELVEALKG